MVPHRFYLFDDDARERAGRRTLLAKARETLVRAALEEGGANVVNPEIVETGSRAELFKRLDAEKEPFLIVVDLTSEHRALNFLGARILRAIAEDQDLGDLSWRVALSKYATAEIASELDGMAHAIVKDVNIDTEAHLAAAVESALSQPLGRRTSITQHPASEPKTDWDQKVRELVEALVGPEAMRGDDFILQNLVKDVPGEVINAELDRERAADGAGGGARRRSVNEFLRAVMAATGEPNTQAAHERVAECRPHLRGATIHEPLTPEAVERAGRTLDDVLPLTRLKYATHRLVDEDFRPAEAFVRRFRAELKRRRATRPNAATLRQAVLRSVLEEGEFSESVETLQYAVWSLSDVIRAEPGGLQNRF